MTYRLDFTPMLNAGGSWAILANIVAKHAPAFGTGPEYNAFCGAITSEGAKLFKQETNPQFDELIAKPEASVKLEPANGVIITSWGSVVMEQCQQLDPAKPAVDVKKYLVVRGGHWLDFEWHTKKVEKLFYASGDGVALVQTGEDLLTVVPLRSKASCDLPPGTRHALIAITNLVVKEESVDVLGLDADLVFPYK